jgi:hypothetical protein
MSIATSKELALFIKEGTTATAATTGSTLATAATLATAMNGTTSRSTDTTGARMGIATSKELALFIKEGTTATTATIAVAVAIAIAIVVVVVVVVMGTSQELKFSLKRSGVEFGECVGVSEAGHKHVLFHHREGSAQPRKHNRRRNKDSRKTHVDG